jgi:hypothetical protein
MSSAPTSFPSVFPTAVPTYGPSDNLTVYLIFGCTIGGILILTLIYFAIGNFTYMDDLDRRLRKAENASLGSVDEEEDNKFHTHNERHPLISKNENR